MTYITKAENVLLADSTGKYTSESVEGALSEVGSHITNNSVHNNYASATGTNSYAVTLSPALTAYTSGLVVSFKAQNANTGASTLNCNSLGAKSIYKNVNEDLDADEIKANQIITVVYDGTNFQIVSGSGGSGGGQMLGQAVVKAVFYNSNVISENLTVTEGINSFSAGPITIADGYNVAIANNARWVIV